MKTSALTLLTICFALFFAGCSHRNSLHTSQTVQPVGSSEQLEIFALFDQWNKSLASGDPSIVASNYASNAILIPTLSNKVRQTQEERIDYFEHFLEKNPRGKIDSAYIRNYGNIAINSGLYTFDFEDGSVAHARYTFVYQKQSNGEWLIIEHHSSKMPE